MQQPLVFFEDLGQMDYQAAWDYQTARHQALVAQKMAHRGDVPGSYPQEHALFLVEHPPVYTLGKSGSMDNLLLDENQLKARGIQFFPINRGGDITYHGPGQIVGYPILDLDCFFNDVHRYVRNIEEVIIRTLAEYGVKGERAAGYTGVWINSPNPLLPAVLSAKARKICAIGVHLSRWVSLHGWAFNVNTELSYFDNIVPCGIADENRTVSSLALELGHELSLEAVKQHILRHFSEVFECRIEHVTPASTISFV
ncbi:MAG: lipoyl(octanoyl) transferase LipB [Chitinophagales bacterium]|nr:lipoyl(octanoyl) transferase LipB [Chitinophagales bacterium]